MGGQRMEIAVVISTSGDHDSDCEQEPHRSAYVAPSPSAHCTTSDARLGCSRLLQIRLATGTRASSDRVVAAICHATKLRCNKVSRSRTSAASFVLSRIAKTTQAQPAT